jgi:1,4-dihydroxy-2-naphthoate polyprenyltransferase
LNSSAFKVWLNAARPQTLAAAFIPVLVGASIAYRHDSLLWGATLVAIFCAFAIQIGTNFANDYFDFVKGADTEDRIGFKRATASGAVAPQTMLRATILTMFIAFLAGLYLVWIGGWVVLWIGLLSLLFGILYTGGPFPLGYNGLGDIFVFIFFGFVAVMGTTYVNTLEWSEHAFWASVPVGALCVNILVVNNLRDVEQDKITGKRTLGVLFGESALKVEYVSMIALAYLTPVYFYYFLDYSIFIILPYLSILFAWNLTKEVWHHEDKRSLNNTLERTAKLMVVFGFLFAAGLIL